MLLLVTFLYLALYCHIPFPLKTEGDCSIVTVQLTLMNAGRQYLNLEDLSGKVFLTSGLGGMSGAQAKAAVVAGCIGVIAEVREKLLFLLCHVCSQVAQ